MKLEKVFKKIYKLIYYISHFQRFRKLSISCYVGKPYLITPRYITLGKNVIVMKGCRIQGVSNYNQKKFNPEIIFDDYSSVQQNLHLTCAQNIYIGRYTAIAANVTITDIHHPYDDIDKPIELQDIIVKPVFIGDDCKIYNNAVILPGSKIGKHCTIAANSVVSGEFPDYCVIAGVPAKIIKKYNFETEQWEKLS